MQETGRAYFSWKAEHPRGAFRGSCSRVCVWQGPGTPNIGRSRSLGGSIAPHGIGDLLAIRHKLIYIA